MIKVEPCKGCGGVVLMDGIQCDPTPLDAQTAGAALLAGLSLHRVYYLGGRPSTFGTASTAVLRALRGEPSERPVVVVTHRCKANAVKAPQGPQQKVGGTRVPKDPSGTLQTPSAAPGTPSSAPSTDRSGAHTAVKPRFKALRGAPKCDGCGESCADGTYASIELGDLVVWAHHVTTCGG